jgi:hypothetical protein
MSGALGFIRANPTTQGFDAMDARLERTRRRDEAEATDAAIRDGVGQMLRQGPAPAAAPPVPPPVPAASAPAPAAPAAPAPAPAPAPMPPSAGPNSITDPGAQTPEQMLQGVGAPRPAPTATASSTPAMRALVNEAAAARRQAIDTLEGEALERRLAEISANFQSRAGGAARADDGGGVGLVVARPPAAAAAPVAPVLPMARTAGPSALPTNPYRPVLDRLVGTPGAGATALNLLQRGESEVTRRQLAASRGLAAGAAADARTRQAAERNILYALGRGEVDVARFLGSQIGMEIPEEILQNSQARTRFAAASLIAQRQYGNDPDQAVVFVQEYLRTGDPEAALMAAGVPRGRAAGWRPEWVLRDNQEVLMFFNPNTRQTWTPGDPAAAPPGAVRAPGARPAPGGAPAGVHPTTGRPILPNADGSVSTEESVTLTHPRLNGGRPTNVPSIWNGQRFDPATQEEEIVNQALASGQTFQAYGTIEEAVAAARTRSNALGQVLAQPGAAPNFVTRAPRAGNTARPSAIAERERVLQLAGYSPQEAAQIAGGAYLTENQRAQAWVRMRQNVEQQVTETREPQRSRAITAALDAARRDFDAAFPSMPRPGAAQPARPGDPGAPPPAPPPPARPAAPAPAPRPPITGIPQRPLGVPPGSMWSGSRQQWRDPAGLLYDVDGNPVRGTN